MDYENLKTFIILYDFGKFKLATKDEFYFHFELSFENYTQIFSLLEICKDLCNDMSYNERNYTTTQHQ